MLGLDSTQESSTKIVSEMTNKEMEHGSSCVTMSRVKRFTDIGIKDGIEKNHLLCVKIRKQKRMEKRMLEEKRLASLCRLTIQKYFT